LVVGDYFKSDTDVLDYTDMANELITWLRSKTIVLALIRDIQVNTGSALVAVIRAVLTRWTAHYQSYKRLLELHTALVVLVSSEAARPLDKKMIVTGDAKARARAASMLEIIGNNSFWHAITRIKRHLEPLAIASNITQASFCRLDTVLLTFGFLMMQYRAMTDEADLDASAAIMESIEKRWAVADQEVFMATVIVNPFYQTRPFALLHYFNNAGVARLLGNLWLRFYSHEAPREFYSELTAYLTHRGRYATRDSLARARCIAGAPRR
ncbi:hypothetical protein FIBSPDRAFT_971865, partial [Athelia psychrophila]